MSFNVHGSAGWWSKDRVINQFQYNLKILAFLLWASRPFVKIQRNKSISIALLWPSSPLQQEVVTNAAVAEQFSCGTPVCTIPHTREAHIGLKGDCFPCAINLHLHPKM